MKFDKLLALVITFMLVLGTIPVLISGVSMTKREDTFEYASYEMELDSTQFTRENILMMLQLIGSGTVYKVDVMAPSLTTYEVGKISSVGTVKSIVNTFHLGFIYEESIIPGVSLGIMGTDSRTTISITTQTNGSTYTDNGVLNNAVQYIKIYGVVKVGE